jgi:HTH-type transcriptional regulator / antitoxin HipB
MHIKDSTGLFEIRLEFGSAIYMVFSFFLTKNSILTSFEHHLDQQYGKIRTSEREKFEDGFEAFKLGVMIQELRKENGLKKKQLAEKCGTTKTYISRIENNASDIRLSTLMRIVREGFGRHLKLSI